MRKNTAVAGCSPQFRETDRDRPPGQPVFEYAELRDERLGIRPALAHETMIAGAVLVLTGADGVAPYGLAANRTVLWERRPTGAPRSTALGTTSASSPDYRPVVIISTLVALGLAGGPLALRL
jgi:hypothetical protein